LLEILRAVTPSLLVEFGQHAVRRDGSEIGAIRRHRRRIIRGGPLVVRLVPIEASDQELGPGYLEQAETVIGSMIQILLEGDQRGIGVSHLTLDPAPGQ